MFVHQEIYRWLFDFLFQLPNHLFEELAMDVYDEVDRRENNQSKFPKNNFVLQLLICGPSYHRVERKEETCL